MRSYPRNSPHAAARIVVLTLLADGHLSRTELNAFLRHEVAGDLGLCSLPLEGLVREVAEDLLSTSLSAWSNGQGLDAGVLAGALAEVDDPVLRVRALAVCRSVAHADGHVSDSEQWLLAEASRRWNADPSLPR